MGARVPIPLANLLSLPVRHFAVVDAGQHRARILHASVARGRPRLIRYEVVDTHEEGFTTPEELREEIRRRLRESRAEAIVLVVPQHQILRHLLDVPLGDAEETRALVEGEASNIGGLSDSAWVFDAVRLLPYGHASHPVVAAFCRQTDLQHHLESLAEDPNSIFDVRPAGEALAAAFSTAAPETRNAILVELGAVHTAVTILAGGQPVFASSFPMGSAAWTTALAKDRGGSAEAAEVLKRTEPPAFDTEAAPNLQEAMAAWLAEFERTLRDVEQEIPARAAPGSWVAYLAGGGSLQPGIAEVLTRLGKRQFERWPGTTAEQGQEADIAVAWGALLLALGLGGPAPSLLPPERRAAWDRKRLWRALVSINLVLAAMLAMGIAAATAYQTRALAAKSAWKERASDALQHALEIRTVAETFNARLDNFRPVLERQRQTVETLRLLADLQRERTNANHWYVLLADAESYSAGSNNFAVASAPRSIESRFSASSAVLSSNAPSTGRAFIAEVCLIPQGEQMRQALSDLVGDLKRYPLFRNVDVLPAERRRELVATNLIFPERHFALELSLSEAPMLAPIVLPRVVVSNREPRGPFRLGPRPEADSSSNIVPRSGRLR